LEQYRGAKRRIKRTVHVVADLTRFLALFVSFASFASFV